MLREGMFIAERYEILEKIGSGGMSDVYKAKCHKLNRYVAIKVLKPEFSEDKNFVSKFRAEAQSAAGLMHANVVNVYDVGEENEIYYIVMELVEGITLKKYIEKKGKLGIREAVSVAIQVAQGIEAAHKHHIVHRDIKPQNIIISKEGKVKVTDFGIARAASSNTINSAVMGSVHYVSPEQARGGYSDEKSDIYSFGITLFEMLTGRVPFEGDTTVAVALQHIQEDMISPRVYLPEIPVSVEKIVLKCTQKRTDRRYQNMTDLIADLKRSLVTPNEDFVIISSAVSAGGPTQIIGEQELAEITQRAAQKPSGPEIVNVEDRYEGAGRREMKPDTDDTEDYDDEEEIEIGESEEDEDDTDIRDKAATGKIDKIITILGIALGVVILIITIIVIVNMVKLFKKDTPKVNNPTEASTSSIEGLVEVPSVLGKTYDEAKEELNNMGLGINKREEYSDSYEAGQIFRQSVDAGQMVDANTTIIVYISMGTESFEMPSVIGDTRESAVKTLENKNLKIGDISYEETDDESKIDTVVSTDPVAGTTVKSGDEIKLVIYRGVSQKTAKVPNVVDKSRDDAVKALVAEGFLEENITFEYEYSDDYAEGIVISQSGAKAGESAPVDTTSFTLVISKGKKPEETQAVSVVPDVKGKSYEDAKSQLEALGFVVVKTESNSDTVAAGLVISQSGAEVGKEAAADGSVTITLEVSLGAAAVKVKATIDSSTITDALVECDDTKPISLVYTVAYTNTNDQAATLQIASVTYDNLQNLKDVAPIPLSETIANAKKGDVTINIAITYTNLSGEEVKTTASKAAVIE
ncbi:MAG: Stk1 family PASTA domain-containing Ser/Thr kinase [Butyrivibrio sp.]